MRGDEVMFALLLLCCESYGFGRGNIFLCPKSAEEIVKIMIGSAMESSSCGGALIDGRMASWAKHNPS